MNIFKSKKSKNLEDKKYRDNEESIHKPSKAIIDHIKEASVVDRQLEEIKTQLQQYS